MTDFDESLDRGRVRLSRRHLLRTAAALGVSSVAGVAVSRGAGGDLRWSFDVGTAVNAAPTVVAGTVFVGSSDSVYALDAATGEQVWTFEAEGSTTAPVVKDETVFVGTGRGFGNGGVYALDAATGGQQWRFGSGENAFTSPAVSGDTMVVADSGDNGTVNLLAAATGEVVGSFETPAAELLFSAVTVADGTAVFGSTGGVSGGTLYAYAVADRETRWTAEQFTNIEVSPTVADGRVFVGTERGRMQAVEFDSGDRVWSADITGSGESSEVTAESAPTVADGRVFLGGSDGNVYALGTASGEQEWVFATGGLVRSSPTVAGGRVFVGSLDNNLYALDAATGEQVWAFETDDWVFSSPTVVDGTVYVGSADGNLYALDAGVEGASRDSRVLLRTLGHHDVIGDQRPTVLIGVDQSNPESNTPVTLTARTGGEIDSYAWDLTGDGSVDATGQTVSRAFEPREMAVTVTVTGPGGEATTSRVLSVRPPRRWRFETPTPVTSAPTIVDGAVYAASADGILYALDAGTGEQVWTFEVGVNSATAPTVVDGTVFVGSSNTDVYALDAATGERVWTFDTGDTVRSSPSVAGGTVFTGSLDGTLYALDAATGERVWTFDTGDAVSSSPVVAGETVFVAGGRTVYALAAASGGSLWRFEMDSVVASSPTVADGAVFVGDDDGRVSALDIVSGEHRWTFEADGAVRSSPTAAGGTVYVGSEDDSLYAVDAGTGEPRWSVETGGAVRSSPTVVGDTVFFGSDGGGLYAVDAETGGVHWVLETDAAVRSPPTVESGTLYAGTRTGLRALTSAVEESSEGSRARLGTLGHPGDWRYAGQELDNTDRGDPPADGDSDDDTDGTGPGGGTDQSGATDDETEGSGEESIGDDGFGPGLGVGAALAALGGLALLAQRQGDEEP